MHPVPAEHAESLCAVQMCKQNGYFPVVDQQNFTDLWAFCVLRLAIRHNNSGDPDNILYDQPLGWWDSDWPGECMQAALLSEAFGLSPDIDQQSWRACSLRACLRPVHLACDVDSRSTLMVQHLCPQSKPRSNY